VDITFIWQNELDVADGGVWPRSLTDAHLPLQHGLQMAFRQGVDDLSIPGDELQPLSVEVRRVPSQPGNGLGTRNGNRYVPVRAELDERHILVKYRRIRVQGLADHDAHFQRGLGFAVTYLVGAQHELGDVDHDDALALHERRP